MSFFEATQNLAIGIVGGIFSSIIVTIVFYVLDEYRNELKKAKDITYPLYGIVALESVKQVPKDKNYDSIKRVREYFNEMSINFSRFDPCQYKYELREAMCEIYAESCSVKYSDDDWDDKILSELYRSCAIWLNKIDECERNFARGFLKRIFRNKIMKIMAILSIAIILIA